MGENRKRVNYYKTGVRRTRGGGNRRKVEREDGRWGEERREIYFFKKNWQWNGRVLVNPNSPWPAGKLENQGWAVFRVQKLSAGRCSSCLEEDLHEEKMKTHWPVKPCGWQGLGALAGCQAWATEVGELSSGPWSTRDLLAPHNIKQRKLSQISPSQCQDPAPLNNQKATVLDTLCQTTSKTGTQTHPFAERLPKIIIRSQTPQNTPQDVVQPIRKVRSSHIHQNTGTSPLHREAYTTYWTKLSHWGQTPETTRTTNLQPGKRRPPNTVS